MNCSIGDLVWAKMKGYSPWPARVMANKNSKRKNFHWIYFFGTHNYAFIEYSQIKAYNDYKTQFMKSGRGEVFNKAVEEIEEYVAKIEMDPSYETEFLKKLELDAESKASNSTPNKDKDKPKKEGTTPTSRQKKGSGDDGPVDSTPSGKGSTTPSESTKKQSATPTTNSSASNASSSKRKTSQLESDEGGSTPAKRTVREKNGTSSSFTRKSGLTGSSENRPVSLDEDDLQDLSSTIMEKCDNPVTDLNDVSQELKKKTIVPSNLTFGFMGLGNMGSGLVKNLINSCHRVNLYNRDYQKCKNIQEQADENKFKGLVTICDTPHDVVLNSDIIFSCTADPKSAKEMLVMKFGILFAAEDGTGLQGKGYVEMSSIDPETSRDIASMVESKGGRYLEVQMVGSKPQAEDSTLILLAAGNRLLFDDCKSCFTAIGRTGFFLGDVGCACQMNLCLSMVQGISLAGLAESMMLVERCGLSPKDFLDIFNLSESASPYLSHKGDMMLHRRFSSVEQRIEYMQKDLKMCLGISNDVKQNVPLAAVANETYKMARKAGLDGKDVAAVSFLKNLKN